MMFAVVPLIPILWVGGGIVVVGILAWLAYRWLKKDPHRDMIVLMGPKTQGKTEFKAALLDEDFDSNRMPTGPRMNVNKFNVGEDDIGHKKIVTCDSDGADVNICNYARQIIEYIDKKHPEFVLIVLVLSQNRLQERGAQSIIDTLGEYLYYIAQSCDKDLCKGMQQRYKKGYWAYAIAITHCAKPTSDDEQRLAQIVAAIEKYKGDLRRMNVSCFELSDSNGRKGTVRWIVKLLKEIHKG
jgi:hypothetical protein